MFTLEQLIRNSGKHRQVNTSHPVVWSPPSMDTLKCNVDASWESESESYGVV